MPTIVLLLQCAPCNMYVPTILCVCAYCTVCSALVGRYDGKRVSLTLLRRLDECKLCSLAYLITTAHTDRRVDGLLHSQLAMNSHELQRSAEHLWAEFITTAQYPKLEKSSRLYKVSD